MVRHDPLDRLEGVRPGVRLSLRLGTGGQVTDLIGLLLSLDDLELHIEDRRGVRHTVSRGEILFARRIPTVPRGRNPLAFETGGLRALAHDGWLAGTGDCWVARLVDLVDHLDDSGVTAEAGDRVHRGESRALVNGEWVAVRLADAAALEPLAAWAARRGARNLVLTSDLPATTLAGLGLTAIQ
ncbi:hypothetical protein [Enemella evansiae]|uniref:hypothetical protein n=1 Tax=Enemella evansiae TaxID=2016499 RepID=UPI000C00F540|nr:hypothetical protein [Enemella evansiae]PFG68115.1 hypothetical protein B0O41_2941 [Propionibacteriaceae bacterium ES.041]